MTYVLYDKGNISNHPNCSTRQTYSFTHILIAVMSASKLIKFCKKPYLGCKIFLLRKWIFSCLENSSLIRKHIPLVQVYHIKHTLWWIDNSSQSQIIIILLPFCKKETSSERRKALRYFEKLDCSWLRFPWRSCLRRWFIIILLFCFILSASNWHLNMLPPTCHPTETVT